MPKTPYESRAQQSTSPICAEWEALFNLFVTAIGEVIAVEASQSLSAIEPAQPDLRSLLEAAAQKKRLAKDALISHQRQHACA